MPIPFIIGGAAIAAGLFGAKKGLDAKNNYAKAKSMVEDALEEFENERNRLDLQKERTADALKYLGETRLRIESDLMTRFVNALKQINQASYKPIQLGATQVNMTAPQLQEIELSSYQAADLMKDGVGAISSGVLTGLGAKGLVASFGAASTGTAISTLSGAAATNATLAWLGGGSLASGGFGVAGGTAVLGGVIAGPAIAVMGLVAAKKSERALTEAHEKEAEILEAIEQVENGISVLLLIDKRINEIQNVIQDMALHFEGLMTKTEAMLDRKHGLLVTLKSESDQRKLNYSKVNFFIRIWNRLSGKKPDFSFPDPFNYNNFSDVDKKNYEMVTVLGFSLYSLLKVQVLDDEGILTDESKVAVADGANVLEVI